MTNYIRKLLFAPSMSLLELIVLIAVTTRFSFWIALPIYLAWCWIGQPLLAKLVGATPAELNAQSKSQ